MLYTPLPKEKIEISNDDLYESMRERLIKDTFEMLEEVLNRNIGHSLEYEWYVDVSELTTNECSLLRKELAYEYYEDLMDELGDYLNHEDEMREVRTTIQNLRGE